HFQVVLRIVGMLLMLFSITQLPPVLVSFLYQDGDADAFLFAFLITLFTGLALWLPVRRNRSDLRVRDGFLVVALFWTVLGSFGSIPFLLSPNVSMSFTDAIFESVSGLTT